MIKVLIADDHDLVRAGIRGLLQDAADIEIVGEAETAAETLAQVSSVLPDVLLLDLSFPDRTGLDVLIEVKKKYPNLAVVILTMHPEDQFAVRAYQAGAAGYLTKKSLPQILMDAIRQVASGGTFMSPTASQKIVDAMREQGTPLPHQKLSNREYQVLCMLGAGVSVSKIAETLNVSVKTISTYRTRILMKMNLSDTHEVIHYVIRNNLV